jgi:hypothetical protein
MKHTSGDLIRGMRSAIAHSLAWEQASYRSGPPPHDQGLPVGKQRFFRRILKEADDLAKAPASRSTGRVCRVKGVRVLS